jgi:hypothetical protein
MAGGLHGARISNILRAKFSARRKTGRDTAPHARNQARPTADYPAGDNAMALRELAAAWVRANCPNPAVQRDFLRHLDRAMQRGVGCSFLIGRELTKSAKPTLVACHCGELFAFDLTLRRAERLHVNGDMLVCSQGATCQDHGSKPEPLIWLEEGEVDHAQALDLTRRLLERYDTEQTTCYLNLWRFTSRGSRRGEPA